MRLFRLGQRSWSLGQYQRPWGCPSSCSPLMLGGSTRRASVQTESSNQERIGVDGSLKIRWPGKEFVASGDSKVERQSGTPSTAPTAPPISQSQLEDLANFLISCKRVVLISGAGMSTESGTPDYRGVRGAYSTGYKPTTHQQFMSRRAAQTRYWARNYASWEDFSSRCPNPAHEGVAALEANRWIHYIMTQNVDALHQKAGSRNVLELHGTTHRVVCTECGHLIPRHKFQSILSDLNPAAHKIMYGGSQEDLQNWQRALNLNGSPTTRPDGDMELHGLEKNFSFPACEHCNGILKPDVVFFGDSVPQDRANKAMALAQNSDGILVMGSSVMVYSAFKLVKAASEAGAKVAIVNVGETRADPLANIKVEGLVSEVATRLASHLSLLTPRPL